MIDLQINCAWRFADLLAGAVHQGQTLDRQCVGRFRESPIPGGRGGVMKIPDTITAMCQGWRFNLCVSSSSLYSSVQMMPRRIERIVSVTHLHRAPTPTPFGRALLV